jgi:signal transduction histidine kinase
MSFSLDRDAGAAGKRGLLDSKIMIVDDEPICIKMVRKYLKDSGYRSFITTTESSRAIDIMKEEHPDIVLLDVLMPKVDGLEILQRRSMDRDLHHIPVLVLTASQDDEIKVKALERGATDFLGKPVDPNELLPRVHNVLTIKAHQDHLANLNVSLEAKVREQTEELQKAYEELSSLDHLKQQFLTLVSHELRTPVTGVLGALELLTGDLLQEKTEQEKFLRLGLEQALRLQKIIEDVELFLTLTAGQVIPSRAPINARNLVEERAVEWRRRAQEKGLSFSVDADASITLSTDLGLLVNSLDRLIDNAVKFTRRGGIALRVERKDSRAVFEVRDTGQGIEMGADLLSPMTIGGRIEHHREGHGLSLAIILRQMQLLDGQIEFESPGTDQGSTFRLILPLERTPPVPPLREDRA